MATRGRLPRFPVRCLCDEQGVGWVVLLLPLAAGKDQNLYAAPAAYVPLALVFSHKPAAFNKTFFSIAYSSKSHSATRPGWAGLR